MHAVCRSLARTARAARAGRAPGTARRALSSAAPGEQPELVELTRASVLADDGRYAEALDQLSRAAEIVTALPESHPLKATVREREARVHHRAGHYREEANAWSRLVKNHELVYAHVDGIAPLTVALFRLGEYKAAMNVAAGGMAACSKVGDQLGVGSCAFLSAYGLYLERAELADEVISSSLDSARDATPRAAVVGDLLKCHGLFLERVKGDVDAGRSSLTKALRFFEKHHADAPEEAAKALVHLGALEGRAKDRAAAEAHFTRALAAIGERYGDGHPALARALRPLAAMYVQVGEPVLAEGLYRSSVDTLKSAIEHTPGCDTAQLNEELATNLGEFAGLMDHLEWNGRKRTAEANELRAEVAEVREKYPLQNEEPSDLWDESLVERYHHPLF